jgi:chemotaxis protein MotB
MTTHSKRTSCLLFWILALSSLPVAWANDLDGIRYGESARTFAAGSIQQSTPQDGVVNVVTGDNQTVGNRMELGQNDVFYLKLKNPGDVTVGDLFTIFKRARKVFHPATGRYMGYLVNRLAVVQVVQVDKVLTTARAIRAYGVVSPGDPVVKFSLPKEEDPASVPSSSGDVTGMVAEIQSDMGLTLVAQNHVVYLDRGREDGLRAGDRLEVVRYGGGLPYRMVGEVKVLSTEARTATALITKSTSRILKGDRVQASEPMPAPVSHGATDGAAGTIQVQQAGRETRFSLGDIAKQLRYESGEASIKPEGYRVLNQLIEELKAAPSDQLIRVEGHADNMEIGPSLKSVYPTNWELSKARAGGVLRYLVEKGGIDSARISSVGFGDTRPVGSNATEAGRQKNRRVDIVLYSAESAKAPTEEAAKPAETIDNVYRAAGLGSDDQSASAPPDNAVPAAPAKVEDSASVSVDPDLSVTTPEPDQSVREQPADQPIVPPQP